jgi:hypothetical protein
MSRNNSWTAYHLQVAPNALKREVVTKAYKALFPELSTNAILCYACQVAGDMRHHSLVCEGERLLAVLKSRGIAVTDFPAVPHVSWKFQGDPIDKLL